MTDETSRTDEEIRRAVVDRVREVEIMTARTDGDNGLAAGRPSSGVVDPVSSGSAVTP